MGRTILILFFAFVLPVCLGQQSICLFNGLTNTTLKPLQLLASNCPNNQTYCMNEIYNYGNWQYRGISSLRPQSGEVCAYLVQGPVGNYFFVSMLNANENVNSTVWVHFDGAAPTNIALYDDPAPQDSWQWNPSNNTGNFTWRTSPGYTDGVVIGPITFVGTASLRKRSGSGTMIRGRIFQWKGCGERTKIGRCRKTNRTVAKPVEASDPEGTKIPKG